MSGRQVDVDVVLRCVGRQIKAARRRAGLEQVELAPKVGYGVHTVSAVEQGRRTPQRGSLEAADRVLDAGGVLAAAVELIEEARAAGGIVRTDEPADVASWHAYAPLAVPVELRTEDYARAVLRASRPLLTDEEVEEAVVGQAAARGLVDREPALLMTCVVEETVLRRPYGGRKVLRGQLAYLAALARRRHVEIQVMPVDAEAHPAAEGEFCLLVPAGERRVTGRAGRRTTGRRGEVRVLEERYGALRAQALPPAESLAFLEELSGPAPRPGPTVAADGERNPTVW